MSKKGGERHKRYGRVFLWLMAVVILTAINGAFFFRDRPFLTVITMTSFYSAYSGYRVLKTKEDGAAFKDFIVMVIVAFVALMFLWNLKDANIVWDKIVVNYSILYLFLVLGFDMLRFFIPSLIKVKRFWLYEHIWKIIGAFSALVSAASGTLLVEFQPWSQIIPPSLGSLLAILWILRIYRSGLRTSDE